jgi:hypothetical protein
MKKPDDFVIVRDLGKYTVVVCRRHDAESKFKAQPTGRSVASGDEYLTGTPEQIAVFLEKVKPCT